MNKTKFLFLVAISAQLLKISASMADFVAQAVGTDEVNDALFLTKALQSNSHPEANIGYAVLLNSNFFKKDKTALNTALAKVSPAIGINAAQYSNHQGPQAVDDMIAMFTSGAGAAVYKKIAPTNYQQAIETITVALESTKSMLQ